MDASPDFVSSVTKMIGSMSNFLRNGCVWEHFVKFLLSRPAQEKF
jgi:hypothetical protein